MAARQSSSTKPEDTQGDGVQQGQTAGADAQAHAAKSGENPADQVQDTGSGDAPETLRQGPAQSDDGEKVLAKLLDLDPAERAALIQALGGQMLPQPEGVPPIPPEVKIAQDASRFPLDIKATKEMSGKEAAKLTGVDYENILGFAVRAPRNVDDEPMGDRKVLVVATNDARKVGVALK